MADIFVSYSRQDAEFGRRLHEALQGQKRDVWMDWEDIPFNSEWWEEIRQGIETCDNFILIISPDFLNSPVCTLEVEYARQQHKRIIPLVYRQSNFERDTNNLLNRAINSETVRSLLKNRDIMDIARDNWRTIGHVNWLLFDNAEQFEDKFRQLANVLDTDLEHVRTHTQIQIRALDWDKNNHNWSFLFSGVQLERAEQWLKLADEEKKRPEPTELHRRFIAESRRSQNEDEANIQRMQNRAKLLRRATLIAGAISAVILIAGLALSVWTADQIRRSRDQLIEAEQSIQLAEQNAVAAQETLTAVPPTLEAFQALVSNNETQVALAGQTLTPVGPTLQAAQNALDDAQTQVAVAGATLTPVGPTLQAAVGALSGAQTQIANSQYQAAQAIRQVDAARGTLTPVAMALIQAATEQSVVRTEAANAEQSAATANAQAWLASTEIAIAHATLTPVGPTLEAAEEQINSARLQISQAENRAAQSNTRVAQANAILTPIPLTLTAAHAQINNAQIEVTQAQARSYQASTRVAEADLILTPIPLTLAAAQQQVSSAQIEVTQAQQRSYQAGTQVAQAYSVLTPIPLTLVAAQIEVTQAQELSYQAGTRVAQADATLTPIPLTLTAASVGVATAQARSEVIQETAVAIEVTAAYSANQALSQSLVVNAEQAALNGSVDLALALALEASELNTELPQTRRLLNDIAYTSARFVVDNSSFVVFSPDSSQVAYAEGDELVIRDVVSRAELMRLSGHTARINKAAFNPDGTLLVTGADDFSVMVWNLATGQAEQRLTDHTAAVRDVTFSPDGSRVAAVAADGRAIVWRIDLNYQPTVFNQQDGIPLYAIRFVADGSRFLTWGQINQQQAMYLWTLSSPSRSTKLLDTIYTVFAPPNATYATTDSDIELTVWNVPNQARFRSFVQGLDWRAVRAGVRTFDNTGNRLLVYMTDIDGNDRNLALMDITRGVKVMDYDGDGEERVTALAYSPDGQTVLSGFGRYLILWDAETGLELTRFGAHRDDIVEIVFSPDSRYATSRSRDGEIRVWDVNVDDPAVVGRIESLGLFSSMSDPAFSPDGAQIYLNIERELFKYDATTLEQTDVQLSLGLQLAEVVYNPAQPQVVSLYSNFGMVWDLSAPASRSLVAEGLGTGERLEAVGTFSTDGRLIALVMESFVRVYDISTPRRPELLHNFQRTNMEIVGMAFSPDSRTLYLAVNADSYTVAAWDLETSQVTWFEPQHIRPLTDIAINPEGTLALTASDDNTLVLWDLTTSNLLRRLAGHRSGVTAAAFGSPGFTAMSASLDGTLILWDLNSGQPLRRYFTGQQGVNGLVLSPDGTIAVSTNGSNVATLWRIETFEEMVDWMRRNRHLSPLSPEECAQYGVTCS